MITRVYYWKLQELKKGLMGNLQLLCWKLVLRRNFFNFQLHFWRCQYCTHNVFRKSTCFSTFFRIFFSTKGHIYDYCFSTFSSSSDSYVSGDLAKSPHCVYGVHFHCLGKCKFGIRSPHRTTTKLYLLYWPTECNGWHERKGYSGNRPDWRPLVLKQRAVVLLTFEIDVDFV